MARSGGEIELPWQWFDRYTVREKKRPKDNFGHLCRFPTNGFGFSKSNTTDWCKKNRCRLKKTKVHVKFKIGPRTTWPSWSKQLFQAEPAAGSRWLFCRLLTGGLTLSAAKLRTWENISLPTLTPTLKRAFSWSGKAAFGVFFFFFFFC